MDKTGGQLKKEEAKKIEESDVIATLRKDNNMLSETIAIRNLTILSLQYEFKRMKTVQQPPGSVYSSGTSGTVESDVQKHLNEQNKIILKQKEKIKFLEVSSKSSIIPL